MQVLSSRRDISGSPHLCLGAWVDGPPGLHQGHVQSDNGVHRFATFSGLNGMFPQNGLLQSVTYLFWCLMVVSEVLPNQQ